MTRKLWQKSISFFVTISFLLSVGIFKVNAYGEENQKEENSLKEDFIKALKEEENLNLNPELKKYLEENKDIDTNDDSEEIRMVIELEEKPAIENEKNTSKKILSKEKKIKNNHKDILKKIEKITGNKKIKDFAYLFNGFSIVGKRSDIYKIRSIDGVKNVSIARYYKPDMAFANKITEAYSVWKDYGYKGEGLVVSIIDTGIDYRHKDLKNIDTSKTKLKKNDVKRKIKELKRGEFFTDKVPFGYNYADGNCNVIDAGNQHGMHVAGIVGANGDDDKLNSLEAVKGVAPEAQLLAMKVFSNNLGDASKNDNGLKGAYDDDIIAAIEDSVKLGADVINMSLGSPAGFQDKNSPEQKAIEKAVEQGVLVVISAGNSGVSTNNNSWSQPINLLNSKDTIALGSPGTTESAFTVASFENTNMVTNVLKYTSKDKSDYIAFMPVKGTDTKLLNKAKGLVYCGFGKEEDFKDKDLKDKIALIERGEVTFNDKVKNSLKAGASGVIIYNHKAGGDVTMGMELQEKSIPSISIGHKDGEILKALVEDVKIEVLDKMKAINNIDKNDISQFSSWGPTPNLEFKPEIIAPGGDIYSLANNDKYQVMSGTSMSSPNIAGSEALILEALKKKGINLKGKELIDFVKNTSMNTAEILYDKYSKEKVPYSPRRQGAGMIQIEDAIKNNVIITDNKGKAAVALKNIGKSKTFKLNLKNYSDKDITYYLDDTGVQSEQIKEDKRIGAYKIPESKVSYDKEKITVPANGENTVNITITLPDNFEKNNFIEGFIRFKGEVGSIPYLSVPYMGFYGDFSLDKVFDPPYYEKTSEIGLTGLGEVGPLGFSLYGFNKDINTIGFSPNDDKLKDIILPNIYLLRNLKTLKIEILDENKNVIKNLSNEEEIRKNLLEELPKVKGTLLGNGVWDGKIYNSETGKEELAKEGNYSYKITFTSDLDDAVEQSLELPFKLDITKPKVEILSLDKETLKDDKDKYYDSYVLTWKAEDGQTDINKSIAFYSLNNNSHKIDKITEVSKGVFKAPLHIKDNEINNIELAVSDNAGNIGITSKVFELGNAKAISFYGNFKDTFGISSLKDNNFNIKGHVSKIVDKLLLDEKEVKLNGNQFEVNFKPSDGVNNLKFKALDKEGRKIINEDLEVKFDLKAPEILSITPNLPVDKNFVTNNSKLKVSGRIRDNNLKTVLVNKEEGTIKNLPNGDKDFEKEVQLKPGLNEVLIEARDEANNLVSRSYKVILVDKVQKFDIDFDNLKSVTVLNPKEIKEDNFKITGHVSYRPLVLKINDEEVKVNDDLSFSYDVKLSQGFNKIKVYGTDINGAEVYNYAFRILYDSKLPKLSLEEPVTKGDGKIYTNEDFIIVKGSVTDNIFGYNFYINGDSIYNVSNYPVIGEDNLKRDFEKKIPVKNGDKLTLKLKDTFGNEINNQYDIVVDKENPNAPKINVEKFEENKSTLKVKLSSDDSKIENILYSFDGKNYFNYKGEFIVDFSTKLYAKAVDWASNESENAVEAISIDKTSPKISIEGVNDGEIYKGNVKPIINSSDKDSKIFVTLNEKPYDNKEISENGNYLLEAYAVDKLGNKSEEIQLRFSIDKEKSEENKDKEDSKDPSEVSEKQIVLAENNENNKDNKLDNIKETNTAKKVTSQSKNTIYKDLSKNGNKKDNNKNDKKTIDKLGSNISTNLLIILSISLVGFGVILIRRKEHKKYNK